MSTGSPIPRAYLSGCRSACQVAAGRAVLRRGREDPAGDEPLPPRLAGRRHHRLRVPEPGRWACWSIPPAASAAGRACYAEFTGRAACLPGAGLRQASGGVLETRCSSGRARRPARAARAAADSRLPRLHGCRGARCVELLVGLPGLSHLLPPAARLTPTGRRSSAPSRAARATRRRAVDADRRRFDSRLLLRERRRTRIAQRAALQRLPAAHRPGDGQGRRGHGLLPLPPPAGAQRGRRRAGRAFGVSPEPSTR